MREVRAIFLNGPERLAFAIANHCADEDLECLPIGFREPLAFGALGLFFSGDPMVDIWNPDLFLPGTEREFKAADFISRLDSFLQDTLGKEYLSRLALKTIDIQADLYQTFIFPDVNALREPIINIRFIASAIKRENCLVVNFASQLEETHNTFAREAAFAREADLPTINLLVNTPREAALQILSTLKEKL